MNIPLLTQNLLLSLFSPPDLLLDNLCPLTHNVHPNKDAIMYK